MAELTKPQMMKLTQDIRQKYDVRFENDDGFVTFFAQGGDGQDLLNECADSNEFSLFLFKPAPTEVRKGRIWFELEHNPEDKTAMFVVCGFITDDKDIINQLTPTTV